MTRSRIPLGAAVAVAMALGLMACGEDDSSSPATPSPATTAPASEDPTTTPAPTDPSSPPGSGSNGGCDEYAVVTGQLMIGMVDPAEAPSILDAFVAAAPDAISTEASTLAAGITAMFAEEGDPFADPAFGAALAAVGDHFYEHCEASAKVDVSGVDYAFANLPAEIPAGRLALRFTNDSALDEPHEIALLRRPEGDTTPASELATMNPDEFMEDYEFIGVAFADVPGTSSVTLLDLEPGSYLAMCFLPTQGDESDPHAAHGMVADLEVTA